MPLTIVSGAEHQVSLAGVPSNKITLSAMYVAIMKSCSTMKAARLDWIIQRFITFEAITLCSESRYALGSSIK